MDKTKLLKNLLEALQMMPDGIDEESSEQMPDAKGVEVVKVKALGDGEMPELDEALEGEECELTPSKGALSSAAEIMKKKKLSAGLEM